MKACSEEGSFQVLTLAAAFILCVANQAPAQQGVLDGEWRSFGGDPGNTKYSPLDQINRDNFQDLEVAFRWASISTKVTKDNPKIRAGQFKAVPIMIDGVLYVSTALSQVAAIDAGTGETIWEYDPKTYERLRRPANLGWQHKGVAYWEDGDDARIIHTTHDLKLVALNAKSGALYPGFGDDGIVDLSTSLGKPVSGRVITNAAPPAICRNTIVTGHVVADGAVLKEGAPGHIRGFDVKTGEMKWIFHTVPQEGEFGNETWEDGSWKYTGATNVWTMMAVDNELGYVYLSTGTPTSDFYGGHRPGDGLFGESVVCLNADTGKRIWHFQAIHHGLWDYDLPTAANLMDITVDGREIKALAQVSKQAFTYVFDRVTGEPVWPIVEREVPQSTVPGERTSKTQPFPTKPPAYDRQGLTEEDLIDFTPELHAEALEIFSEYMPSPLYTPPPVEGEGKPTINLPGDGGGTNWTGAAFDPETGMYYVPSYTRPVIFTLGKPDPSRSNLDYFPARWAHRVKGPQGLPLTKPPYSRVTAIDMSKGNHAWMQPHGDGPKNHPALKDLDLPPLGGGGAGAPLLTKTLLLVSGGGRDLEGAQGWLSISAYDKATGEYLGVISLPKYVSGNFITYMHKGKQYIAYTSGSGRSEPELVALCLP